MSILHNLPVILVLLLPFTIFLLFGISGIHIHQIYLIFSIFNFHAFIHFPLYLWIFFDPRIIYQFTYVSFSLQCLYMLNFLKVLPTTVEVQILE